jgi:hypothetical protein
VRLILPYLVAHDDRINHLRKRNHRRNQLVVAHLDLLVVGHLFLRIAFQQGLVNHRR